MSVLALLLGLSACIGIVGLPHLKGVKVWQLMICGIVAGMSLGFLLGRI